MRGLPPEQRYIRLFVLVIMVNVVIMMIRVTMILMIKASYCIFPLSCERLIDRIDIVMMI